MKDKTRLRYSPPPGFPRRPVDRILIAHWLTKELTSECSRDPGDLIKDATGKVYCVLPTGALRRVNMGPLVSEADPKEQARSLRQAKASDGYRLVMPVRRISKALRKYALRLRKAFRAAQDAQLAATFKPEVA